MGNEDGELNILATGKELQKLAMIEFPAPIYAGPIAANGVLSELSDRAEWAIDRSGAI
jgi:hypothetical protein